MCEPCGGGVDVRELGFWGRASGKKRGTLETTTMLPLPLESMLPLLG